MDKFMLSMTTNLLVTYAQNCSGPGLGATACYTEPNFATNYFNMSSGPYPNVPYNVTVDGYELRGYEYDQAVCLSPENSNAICTPWYSHFFVADTLVNNDWNFGSPSTAGIIGLGDKSAVWTILDLDSPEYYISFTNSTSWEFADPNYKPVSTQSSISLGTNAMSARTADANITLTPAHNKAYMYTMSEFGFGVWNSSD